MAVHPLITADPARDAALELLDNLLGNSGVRDIAVRLWDGTTWRASRTGVTPRATLVINDATALRRMLSEASDLTLGEMFVYGDLDVEGNLEAIFPAIDWVVEQKVGVADRLRYAALLRKLPKSNGMHDGRRVHLPGSPHSKQRDAHAVRYHYDVSNSFYSLWLDRRMVYSCAYFKTPQDTIDQAQEQKLDYICRKLRLKPGDRLLDIGCGWGALILHAAQHYSANALGITLSRHQFSLANQRIAAAGLSDRCRAEICDYRDLDESSAFDKIVSVGMFEHVGEKMLPEYFRRAFRLLRSGGVFLNHGIAQQFHKPDHGESFVNKYVFPDGELVPIATTIRVAEDTGFEVRDVENLREHYMLTLRHWVQRLEQHAEQAKQVVDDFTYRIWRLYMSGGAHRFRTGWLNLYQTLLLKPEGHESHLPLTRADWYA